MAQCDRSSLALDAYFNQATGAVTWGNVGDHGGDYADPAGTKSRNGIGTRKKLPLAIVSSATG